MRPPESTFERINRESADAHATRKRGLYSYRLRDGGRDHSTVESMAMLQGYTGLEILGASSEGVYFEPIRDRALRDMFSTRITHWRKKEIIQFARWLRQTADSYQGRVDPVNIPDLQKTCGNCGETFPNDPFYFYPHRGKGNGAGYLRATCRRCENRARSERRRRARQRFSA
jgi:hypothetical protein